MTAEHPRDRPNMIWILCDQLRSQALSCMGDENVNTPNLDRLAGSHSTAIAGCPLCSPFRGSLLTSRYPNQCIPGHDHALPAGLPTVATVYNQAGYHTSYFGKWHMDGEAHREKGSRGALQFVAPDRRGGFQQWLGYENNNNHFDSYLHGHDTNGNEIKHEKLDGFETDALTSLFIDHLKECGKPVQGKDRNPFFSVLSVHPPHTPYLAPDDWMESHHPSSIKLRPNVPPVPRVQEQARRDLAGYYSMIENLDWNAGRILNALEEADLAKNTYVVFFSDHGDMHGSQGRSYKCVPWEESIRIPFFVTIGRRPCSNPQLTTERSMINHVDIGPTSLDLCGIDKPDWMQGTSYATCFDKSKQMTGELPDSAYLQLVDPGFTYGIAADRERPWRGIVTRDGWKYAVLEGQPWLMYNLNEDPFETANLALDGRFWKQRDRLQAVLEDWLRRTDDSFKLPDITHDNKYISSAGIKDNRNDPK